MAQEMLTADQLAALRSLTVAAEQSSLDEALDLPSLRVLARLGLARRSFRRTGGGWGHEHAVFSITDLGWRTLRESPVAH